jgi:energy-coupling factor transport system ATP-binding protein
MISETIIEFKDFGFQYRARKVPTLANISLKVRRGEKILIAGSSGSGKNTLGSCLNGLIPFNFKGTITRRALCRRNTRKCTKHLMLLSQTAGTVLQDTDFQFVVLTVAENIAFSLENAEVELNEMKERVKKTAFAVEALECSSSPFSLSGCQKQRISMAGVIVNDTPIMLFDEPLASPPSSTQVLS